MWQYVVVILIGLLAVGYVVRQVYKTFFSKGKDGMPCGGCDGCPLKDACEEDKNSLGCEK